MKTQHTPGPWELARYGNEKLEVQGGPGKLIAVVYPMDGPKRQYPNANAALISAAPDLLAACEALVDVEPEISPLLGADLGYLYADLCQLARAAIAKARVQSENAT